MGRIGLFPRAVGAAVMIGLLAAMAGSASALTVDGGLVQAGGDNSLTCDVTGVSVRYTVAFSGGDYRITAVTVNGFATDCVAKLVEVTLTQGGTPIATASGSVTNVGTGGNKTTGPMVVAPQPVAAVVDDVHLLVIDSP